MDDNKKHLDYLYYEIGKQKDNFKVAKAWLIDGEIKWSKWRTYIDVQEYENALTKLNNRTILKNEIVLDSENKEDYKKIISGLKKDKLNYIAYFTGSRGYHFHLFFCGLDVLKKEQRTKIKLELINKYECDEMKAGEKCMIALETAKHYKTGKPMQKKANVGDGINDNLKALFRSIKRESEETEMEAIRISFLDNKKVGRNIIANKLIEKYHFKTVYGKKTDEIYYYEKGIYIERGDGIIHEEVENILSEVTTTHEVNEIVNKIKRKTRIERALLSMTNPDLICMNNCILHIQSMKTTPHSANYIFLKKIPIDYTSSKDCPKIKKFLSEILYEEDISLIQEYVGYFFYRHYFLKKAIIFVGEPDTGKTTLINVIIKLVGNSNKSGESLHKITTDKFSAANMYGMFANIYDDLDYKDIVDNGAFKIATGAGYVTAEEKFGDKFQFQNYAKLLFATNKIPNMIDVDDEATYRRWMIIRFKNQYTDENPKTDKFLIKKLTEKNELQGFLNFALEGLKRLLKNQKFSYKKTWEDNKKIMQRSANSIAAFEQDMLEKKENNWITKEKMYQKYCEYTRRECLPRGTKEKLGRELPKYATYTLETKKDTREKKKVRGWLNVKIREKETIPLSSKKAEKKESKEEETEFQIILLEYIWDNEGVNVLDLLLKYEKEYSETDIMTMLEKLEKENRIEKKDNRYFKKG